LALSSLAATLEMGMDRRTAQTIELARGTRQLVSVTQGSLVLVRRGAVLVRPPPEWPADTFTHVGWRLDAEETFAATASGYAELVAIDSAEVLLIPAEPFMAKVMELAATVCRSVQAWWAPRRSVR
jgi:hypothetical protein